MWTLPPLISGAESPPLAAARHSVMLLAAGRVERQAEVVHLQVEGMAGLDAGGAPLDARSRDFH